MQGDSRSRPVPGDGDVLSTLGNRYVLGAFVVQVLSYAVLVGTFEHGAATPPVALVRHLPTALGAVLAVFAIPAVAIAVGLGAALEFVTGVSPELLGIGLVSDADLPVLVVAYLLSVAAGTVVTGRRRRRETGDSRD